MLWRHQLGSGHCFIQRTDHEGEAIGQCLPGNRRGWQVGKLKLDLVIHVIGQTQAGRHQEWQGVDVVLRLGKQVGGDQRGVGPVVGDDQDLARAGKAIYPNLTKERPLRGCYILVPRAHDEITGRRQNAKGQAGDGLGATDREQAVGPGDGGCGQGDVGRAW